jgi:hypothetical protein
MSHIRRLSNTGHDRTRNKNALITKSHTLAPGRCIASADSRDIRSTESEKYPPIIGLGNVSLFQTLPNGLISHLEIPEKFSRKKYNSNIFFLMTSFISFRDQPRKKLTQSIETSTFTFKRSVLKRGNFLAMLSVNKSTSI